MTRIFILFLAALLVAAPAHASGKITERMIQDFYKKSHDSFRLSYEEYIKVTLDMIADDYRATVATTYTAPGKPKHQETIRVTRKEILRDLHKEFENMRTATMNYRIQEIQISPSGKTATVRASTTASGISMDRLPATMNYKDSCQENFILNAQGILQIRSSDCTAIAVVMPRLR